MSAFRLICCGCMRVMDADGKPGVPFSFGGLISDEDIDKLKTAPDFPDHASADNFARGFGWTVVDDNHRCPECHQKELLNQARKTIAANPPRRGGYIELPDIEKMLAWHRDKSERAETPVQPETRKHSGYTGV